MKKIKIFCTYLIAILCVMTALLYRPKEVGVFKTDTIKSNKMMIYMLDNDKELVPVTVSVNKKDSDEINIMNLMDLMKKDFNIHEFNHLIPNAIQCLNVNIVENVVQLNFNEAIFAMNSKNELRLIEGIVGSVVHLNPNYKVEFYVNNQKINQMPLSELPMKQFDSSLGVNNFELYDYNLHKSISRQVVNLKSNDKSEYYIVKTKRVSDENILTFVNEVIHDISMDLECFKIDYNENEWVLHLNEKFLIEENTVDKDKVMLLLYTLKMNQFADNYVIKINDEIVRVDGFEKERITFQDLNLNTFEE